MAVGFHIAQTFVIPVVPTDEPENACFTIVSHRLFEIQSKTVVPATKDENFRYDPDIESFWMVHRITPHRRDAATFFRKANVVNKGKSAFSAAPHPYFQSNGGKIFQERQKISLY